MRKIFTVAMAATAALGLAACSEQTQDAADATVDGAVDDTAANVDALGEATDEAVDDAAAAVDGAAAEAEADVQDESVAEAQVD